MVNLKIDHTSIRPFTLNKKSLNQPGDSVLIGLLKKILIEWMNFASTILPLLNQLSIFQWCIDPLQLIEEKEKKPSGSGLSCTFQKKLSEC